MSIRRLNAACNVQSAFSPECFLIAFNIEKNFSRQRSPLSNSLRPMGLQTD
jgi:hypothetical protein